MINLRILYIALMVFLLGAKIIYAQKDTVISKPVEFKNPPVNMETVFGHTGMAYQLMVNKKLKTVPKLGFFSITSIIGSWDKDDFEGVMTQGLLTYRLIKGLDAVAGFHYTDITGLRPTAGAIYTYASKNVLVVANPRIDLTKDAYAETMVFVEYKPSINNNWKLYTRVQGLYGFAVNNGDHGRSYLLTRLGATTKEFSFGLAANFDRFGPFKASQSNYGVFVAASLF